MQNSFIVKKLLDKELIQPEQLEVVNHLADADLLDYLVDHKILTEEELVQELAELYGIEYIDLKGRKIEPDLFKILPAMLAHRYLCVPLELNDDVLIVAISEKYIPSLEGILERSTGHRIVIKMATSSAIKTALEASGTASQLLSSISSEFGFDEGLGDVMSAESLDLSNLESEEATVSKLINGLILDALQKRASDIHIEVEENNVFTKYRVDGVMQPAAKPIDARHHATLISRLKVMAELDIAEKRIPQDGKFRLGVGGRNIDFRVSIMPGVYGEDVVIRILDKSVISADVTLKLNDLGFDEETTTELRKAISEPYGMVLITGPTGSGKTTTLYAALSEINDGSQKIITIEDPVEYQLPGVVQIPVNEKKNLTFSRGLRSILRHDPDKVMVGEIRDLETAEIAIQSSLTGHLVFSTVHANNVFDVIGRFTHMGVDVYNFVSALNCVMAQRLVRKICPACKQVHEPDDAYLEFSGLIDSSYASSTWYVGCGCHECGNSGYKGRTTLTEYLRLTPTIREMIIERQPSTALFRQAREDGLVTLREAGLNKAARGETSLMEVNRVTFID
ncbi:MAG: type II/IV secretion system protein [Gammaproteobacteria bacterium]|nr:type II/IV secretion system protein [Gammaproteobacteria bacterium]